MGLTDTDSLSLVFRYETSLATLAREGRFLELYFTSGLYTENVKLLAALKEKPALRGFRFHDVDSEDATSSWLKAI